MDEENQKTIIDSLRPKTPFFFLHGCSIDTDWTKGINETNPFTILAY